MKQFKALNTALNLLSLLQVLPVIFTKEVSPYLYMLVQQQL